MKVTFDDSKTYIRINSIDDIDFENLPEPALRGLAKAYSHLLKDSIIEHLQAEKDSKLDYGATIEAGVISDVTTNDSLR